ncbi:hypothetical protein VZ95_00340 [Elstera litoralis]|uniref:Uncharacterized protein n=2 Tax=Elstera litoralis TaxID=552518 RepID=A0A0F3IWT9_9PROT|nr:hypothetical protein VZ95_00340 [Elstera litoralis]
MLVDLASAHVLVEELKMGGAVETHPLILSQADIHFMVSKAGVSEDIYKRLNTAAETMKKSPEVQAIYRQYSSQ